MTVFFTSDTHFGHANIISFCGRPFKSVDQMNRDMTEKWNAVVGKKDTVYHLGDFSMKNARYVQERVEQLNGNIHLIWGNHDRASVRELPIWKSSSPLLEVSINGQHIVLCHYAMRTWNRSHHGSLMLYGHSHGMLPGNTQSLDVGVDMWDFVPATLPQIQDRLQLLTPFRQ